MKKYPSYKDSGIEWIGEIPSNCGLRWLKHYFNFEKGINAQIFTKEYLAECQGEYPVYSGQTENEGVMGRINRYEYDTDKTILATRATPISSMTLKRN